MKILLLEPFYTSSHKQWADSLVMHTSHSIELLTLPGRHWKWRMHHAGKYFAFEIAQLDSSFDLILCSDLMNVAEFRGILSALGSEKDWFRNVPIATYFHENQITYPWSKNDQDPKLQRDNHYGWINYASCLASDAIAFNSEYHRTSFLSALPNFLDQFPKVNQNTYIDNIHSKSLVLPIGMELNPILELNKQKNDCAVILWNHRWEYDKNPELFFTTLFDLDNEGIDFRLIVAGENYTKHPKIFNAAKSRLKDKTLHFGFAKSRKQYLSLIAQSDILPVTSNQDFFGISAIEGIAAGNVPLLPRRLAFSEHLQNPEDQKYYYDNDSEFKELLVSSITNYKSFDTKLRKKMLKYDVQIVSPNYDKWFQKVVTQFHQQ